MKLLSGCCCEGGDSVGYARAGFEVEGVDLFEDFTQARYPFRSHKADVLTFLKDHGHEYDAVHVSPPCQHASAGTRAHDRSKYPRLIEPVREVLRELGKPYVIENVEGADLIDPLKLCGCMFDLTAHDEDGELLRMERPRLFESNMPLVAPGRGWCNHDPDIWVAGCYGGAHRVKRLPGESLAEVAPRDRYAAKYIRHGGYVPRSKRVLQDLMGIDWMTVRGMHQAIPPVYAEHIGRQILQQLGQDSYRNGVRHSPNCASFMGLYCSAECAAQNSGGAA